MLYVCIVLAISITVNFALLTYLLIYRKPAKVFEMLSYVLLDADWENAMKTAISNWAIIVEYKFDDIVRTAIAKNVSETVKEFIENKETTASEVIALYKKMQPYLSGTLPFSSDALLSFQKTMKDKNEKLMNLFRDKVNNEYWVSPLGKKIVIVASVLPERSEDFFLIEKMLSVDQYERSLQYLLEFFSMDNFLEEFEKFTSEEQTAAKKINAFYQKYYIKNHETEMVRKKLATLFEVKKEYAA